MKQGRNNIIDLIARRLVDQFGRGLLRWVIVPIVFLVVINLLLLFMVHVECWLFGEARYYWTPYIEVTRIVCRPVETNKTVTKDISGVEPTK
jgi:hypothetical protein